MNLTCSDYNDNCIVVRGKTFEFKDRIKKEGGIYNAKLKGGPGWIFPKTKCEVVNAFVQEINGESVVVNTTPKIFMEIRKKLKEIESNYSENMISTLESVDRKLGKIASHLHQEDNDFYEEEVSKPMVSFLR